MLSASSIKSLIHTLRLKEILLMTGFSFIGVLFTDEQGWWDILKNCTVFLFILFYVTTVYFLNSFADYKADIHSARLKDIGKISRANYIWLFVFFALLFFIFSLLINTTVFFLSLSSLCLWCLYYLPPFRLKSSLFGGTGIHFLAGILHFLTGYCCYSKLNESSIIVAVFFALLLSVGHFHHEILDYDADKISGNKTTAVRLGLVKMYYLRITLILITLIYWIAVFTKGYVDGTAFVIFIIPTFALAVLALMLHQGQARLFQQVSRGMFLLAGLVLLTCRFLQP